MAIDPYANCNTTIPSELCTLDTCCLAQSSFHYRPDFGGNLFFCVFFGTFIVPQLGLSVWKRTWGFGAGMLLGLVLEVVGYAARIILHNNPFNNNGFLMYLICLTIAPVFVTAAIYLCLTRIMVLFGEDQSFVRPRTVAITFMTSDFCSLVLQAAGGGIAETANDNATAQKGLDVMIAGLLLQAISIGIFLTFMTIFGWRSRTAEQDPADMNKQARRNRPLFRVFLVGLVVATVSVLVRSIFRVVELWGGFQGELWNNETDFLVLDGAMMAFAVLLLTVLHPGMAFGADWSSANWSFKATQKSEGGGSELAQM